VALDIAELRRRFFLSWDDDGGGGYAAHLEFTVLEAGNYRIVAGASLSTLGRAASGDYELVVGLNASGQTEPAGEPFVEPEPGLETIPVVVEEKTGSLTAEAPQTIWRLSEIGPGETLYVNVAATSGDLRPIVILRDFGDKPLQAANNDHSCFWTP
jgi:hypothetical protein